MATGGVQQLYVHVFLPNISPKSGPAVCFKPSKYCVTDLKHRHFFLMCYRDRVRRPYCKLRIATEVFPFRFMAQSKENNDEP